MPQLPKIEHEVFARAVVEGLTNTDAYLKAAGEPNADTKRRASAVVTANKWLRRADIDARIRELRDQQVKVEQKAVAKSLNIHEITMDKIIGELAKIGFADLREAIKWGAKVMVGDGDGNEIEVENTVCLVDSDKLPEHIAGAIKSISQTAQGIKIEFHDKKAALLALKEWREKVDEAAVDPGQAANQPRSVDKDYLQHVGTRYLKVMDGGKA